MHVGEPSSMGAEPSSAAISNWFRAPARTGPQIDPMKRGLKSVANGAGGGGALSDAAQIMTLGRAFFFATLVRASTGHLNICSETLRRDKLR